MKTPATALLLLLSVSSVAVAEQFVFRTAPALSLGHGSLSAVADFNGDGRSDLLLRDGNTLAVVVRGDAGLDQRVVTTTAASAQSPVVIDFDRDGKLDVVFLTYTSQTANVVVMLGNGDGSFRIGSTMPIGIGEGLAVADFTGDSRLDVAVGRRSPSFALLVYPGVAGGGFGAPLSTSLDDELRSAAVVDFNRDGIADLLVYGSANTRFYRGKGDGTFIAATPVNGAGPSIVADFNRDGNDDLAVATDGELRIFLTVSNALQLRSATAIPRSAGSIATADLNGDGNVDIVVNSYGVATSVLPGAGDGTFQAPRIYTSEAGGGAVFITDFDGDGFADVLTSDAVSFLRGRGDGTLEAASAYLVGDAPSAPRAVGLADFDGDGKLDMVATITGVQTAVRVVVFRNLGGTFAAPVTVASMASDLFNGAPVFSLGDVNGDGRADLVFGAAVTLLGNGNGTFTPVTGTGPRPVDEGIFSDVNGDNRVDLLIGASSSLFLGSGDGKFAAPAIVGAPGSFGDVNADGRFDFVTADGRLFFNDGSGRFAPTSVTTGPFSNVIGLADLNRDGRADAILYDHKLLSVRLATVSGGFAAAITTTVDPQNVVWNPQVADFDRDGAADLLLGPNLFLGRGDGSFRAYADTRHLPVPHYGGGWAIGDVDGNGTLDLAITNADRGTIDVFTTRVAPDGVLPATLSFTATPSPSYSGTPVRLDVRTHRSSIIALSGAIRIADGDRTIALVKTVDDLASPERPFLVGSHFLTATISGDERYVPAAATTNLTTLPVEMTLAVTAQNPSVAGRQALFSITFSTVNGQPPVTSTGTITIREGNTVLASAPVTVNGTKPSVGATFATAGTHNLTITFTSDSPEIAPTSIAWEQYVGASNATSGKVAASSTSPKIGEPVTLQVTLNCCTVSYTGTVTFSDNGKVIGVAPVADAKATLTYSFISSGAHRIDAFYSGDSMWSALKMTTNLFIAAPPKRRAAGR